MKVQNLILCVVLSTSVTAQIDFSDLVSEAQSLYTAVTSVLGNPLTTTSSSSSRTTSSRTSSRTSSSSSSLTSTSASSASAAASLTNSAAAQSSSASSSVSAAAAAATANGNSNGGGSSNTLPIVLGCTLGALALAAFLALFFLCRRRRRRSKMAAKHSALSPSDDESDIWAREKSQRNSFKGPTERTRSLGATNGTAAAPLMSQHGFHNHHGHPATYEQPLHDNSYTPIHPSTKATHTGTALRGGDATSNVTQPYSPDHVQPYAHPSGGLDSHHEGNHHHGNNGLNAAAAGVGGAALGGLAMHATDKHNRRRSGSHGRNVAHNQPGRTFSEDDPNMLPQTTVAASDRRSGSVGRASTKEPWPYTDTHERTSMDSSRSRPHSMNHTQERYATPDQYPHERHSMPSGAALAGTAAAGGLVGAAATRKAGSRSPHRKGILKQRTPDSSSPPIYTNTQTPGHQAVTTGSGPHELASADIPPVFAGDRRQRRDSPLGRAAPAAALGANHSPSHARRRSWSTSPHRRPLQSVSVSQESSRDSAIPRIPSRSPRRTSVHSKARYSMANEGTVELPSQNNSHVQHNVVRRDLVSPALGPYQGPMENDGIVSPISPDTSNPGTWSDAQAREMGLSPTGATLKPSSQETTDVGSTPLHSNSNSNSTSDYSTSSKENASGLVSAIQRIFNSQRQAWPSQESVNTGTQPRRSLGDRKRPEVVDVYNDGENRRISNVPRRKAAPIVEPRHESQYGDIGRNNEDTTPAILATENNNNPLTQTTSRKSGDSAHSVPLQGGRYYARVNSLDDENERPNLSTITPAPAAAVASANPATNTNMNSGRPRSTSGGRPSRTSGYGIGSGDPFDLARVRTDSSMTGVSLSNYVEPATTAPHHQQQQHSPLTHSNAPTTTVNSNTTARPHTFRTSSSSNDYREPTLAELKREVEREDRERMRRASWKSAGGRGRKSVEGQRYGDDGELFDLAVPGVEQFDHFYGRRDGHVSGHSPVGRAM